MWNTDALDLLIEEHWRSSGAPGIAVAVRMGGAERYARAFGWAVPASRKPVTKETRFGIGSITKTFTAAAILRLAELGQLEVTQPVTDFLPELRALGSELRLHHLLSHTSGLRSPLEVAMLRKAREASLSLAEALALISGSREHLTPGERWEYCNSGYYLLGHVAERAYGAPLKELLARELVGRAQITGVHQVQVPKGEVAAGHVVSEAGFRTVDAPSPLLAFGSGDLYASASALARWAEALFGGEVLSEASTRAMCTPAVVRGGGATQYGYGVYVADFEGWPELSHDGNTAGFSCQVAWYPSNRLSVAVLLNDASHVAERIEKAIAALLLGLRSTEQEVDLGRTAALECYAGTYYFGSRELRVEVADGRLSVETPSGRRALLTPAGPNTFIDATDMSLRYEFCVEDGRAKEFCVRRYRKCLGSGWASDSPEPRSSERRVCAAPPTRSLG